jgi:hypothetical protein
VSNSSSENSLAPVTHAFGLNGAPPAELGSQRDFAEALSFTRQKARRLILVNDDERCAEPARCHLDEPPLLGLLNRMKARTWRKTRDVTTSVKIDDHVYVRPNGTPYKVRDSVGDSI